MSNTNEIIAAIDIGTTKIVAIAGEITPNGELQILGLEKVKSLGVVKGVIQNINQTIDAIREVVTKLQEKTNLKIDKAYVGIAGQHIRSLKNRQFKYIQNSSQTVTQEDIDTILQDNFRIPIQVGEQILHVIPQDYVVDKDKGIKNPIGMAGRRIDGNFNIIIGRSASARNIENCVKAVDIDIEELILEPLASSLAVLTPEEKEAGAVLVDIGGGTTDITVYFDGVLRHTAVIPFGGDVVTKDIKEGCHLLLKQAEALKVQFGEAIERLADMDKVVNIPQTGGWDPKEIAFKTLAQIIQCRMEEILDRVKYQIDMTPYGDKLGAGIVLTGGGAMLKNLDVLTKERLGLDVRIGYPNASSKIKLDDAYQNPIYATSIGLLLKGLNKSLNNTNDRIETQPRSKKNKFKFKRFFETLFDN
ncbi:cell division protein FtsA [Ancylomarina sp. 16SWW S1-10-2]|uniref:cell division protein FtsA n=1 Tax=Ancylomarina sp. 16SWW S1-10-2 TaxID=2499681 RepID=UPI0012AD3465|nr:cell division protein FtsA [Ancylomarina sp. 16SWW S1-10-2]MRT94187.1 cell division protein FtsA [Ancylomarina sp. 16SWW S1-10-2]